MQADTQEWTNLVAKGLELKNRDENIQWEWGDLLLKAAPQNSHKDVVAKVINEFAKEVWPEFVDNDTVIKSKVATLREYREVAIAYSEGQRQMGVSYTIHRELRRLPTGRRQELLFTAAVENWSVSKARREAGLKAFANLTPQTAEEKVEAIKKFFLGNQGEEVASIILSDPEVSAVLVKISKDQNQETGSGSTSKKFYDSVSYLTSARTYIEKAIRALADETLDEEYRIRLKEAIAEVRNTLDWLESVASAEKSIEEALAEFSQ